MVGLQSTLLLIIGENNDINRYKIRIHWKNFSDGINNMEF